jgi:hypothetical protein
MGHMSIPLQRWRFLRRGEPHKAVNVLDMFPAVLLASMDRFLRRGSDNEMHNLRELHAAGNGRHGLAGRWQDQISRQARVALLDLQGQQEPAGEPGAPADARHPAA